MEIKFSISTIIQKEPAEVFKAVIAAKDVEKYFVDKSSGDLNENIHVRWTWNKYGTEEIEVKEIIDNKQVNFDWDNHCGDRTSVEMKFFEHDEGTLFQITEKGWKENEKSLKNSYDNCSGWQAMASSLKAYLEFGVSLKSGTVCE